MPSKPSAPPPSAAARLRTLVLVLGGFFVLPAALFFKMVGAGGSPGVAVMILALTLPATGALIIQLNPDLLPDRGTLRQMTPLEWVNLTALGAVLIAVAWWLAGLVAGG